MSQTILMIDDDTTNVNLLQMFLKMEGFVVDTATDLDTGMAKLKAPVAAVLVDYHLPQNKSGLSIIEAIRKGDTELSDTTPIIIASGDDRIEAEVLAAGGNRFLLKPFSPTDLTTILKDALS